MTENARRLFVALWPSDQLRHDIEHETRHAARHSGGRVIPARNLHMTLAFLGSIPESRVTDVANCVRAMPVHPFELTLGELKYWQRQELLCLEPMESDRAGATAVGEMVEKLVGSLRNSGIAIERRPFRAHVTLAREVRRGHEFKPIRQLRWQVHRVELLESTTSPRGSEYTVLPT